MHKLAVLVGQFAVAAAAGSYVHVKVYAAKDCTQAALRAEKVYRAKDLCAELELSGDCEKGTCMDLSKGEQLASRKASCVAGFLVVEGYTESATCGGAGIRQPLNCFSSSSLGWSSWMCDVDTTGYDEFVSSAYSSKDCSGDPLKSVGWAAKLGSCMPAAEPENGKWNAASEKYTRSGDVVTQEKFSTMDCSGMARVSQHTCGVCEVVDGSNVTWTCEPVSGAVQPTCILPALILLAVGAVQG